MTMIKNKKILMALSFCVGAVLLATTAFADITTKTGYDQLKDSAKFTAESLTEKLQSYTMEGTFSVKDNDNLLALATNTSKFNNSTKQQENTTHTETSDGTKNDSFTYMDDKIMISHGSDNDTYYVNNFPETRTVIQSNNPFKQSGAKDVEKIVDALVGNLKDYIVVNDKADGSKELSGSLSEAQIPSLINALASFGFKQTLSRGGMYPSLSGFPQIVDDIFIKNAKGNVNVNKDGIIESFLGSATLSGKDKDGKQHDLTVDVLLRITDINLTTVTKPDLTGKKIQNDVQPAKDTKSLSQSFVGKYKNDIDILKDDKYIKVGERIVEITQIADNHIIGKYTEEYKPEYASEYTKNDITFDAEVIDPYNAQFTSTNSDGKKLSGNISWNMQSGNINFWTATPGNNYDANFSRVFD